MPAIAYSKLTFSRLFTPQEQSDSYANRLTIQTQVDQERVNLGITHFEELITNGLEEYHFYVSTSTEQLTSYFTIAPFYNTRKNWVQAFSIQCDNIITFNDPMNTVAITEDINTYVVSTMYG